MLNSRRAALGFRAHSGWADLAVVGGFVRDPVVIECQRIQIADPHIRGSLQPYHAAKAMPIGKAQTFLDGCAAATQQMAETAIRETVAAMAGKRYAVTGACLLLGSGRPTTDLAATLRSHVMIHTAEGHFFRDAIKTGCESCDVPVLGIKEKELVQHAASVLGLSTEQLQHRVAGFGKTIGPPWRHDEKLCAIAGWLALSDVR